MPPQAYHRIKGKGKPEAVRPFLTDLIYFSRHCWTQWRLIFLVLEDFITQSYKSYYKRTKSNQCINCYVHCITLLSYDWRAFSFPPFFFWRASRLALVSLVTILTVPSDFFNSIFIIMVPFPTPPNPDKKTSGFFPLYPHLRRGGNASRRGWGRWRVKPDMELGLGPSYYFFGALDHTSPR